MAATIDRTDLIAHLADLRARRPSLALQAARGDAGARQQLATIDADIVAAERDVEVLALADQEARRLAAVQVERAATAERARLEGEYVRAEAARTSALADVEANIGALVESARRADAAGAELDRLAAQLGRPSPAGQHGVRLGVVRRLNGAVWAEIGWVGMVPGGGTTEPLVNDGGAS